MANNTTLNKIDQLVFDDTMAQRWECFEKQFKVYRTAALKRKDPDEVRAALLNLTSPDAIDIEEQFVYLEEFKLQGHEG